MLLPSARPGCEPIRLLLDHEPQRTGEDEVTTALRLLVRVSGSYPRAFDLVLAETEVLSCLPALVVSRLDFKQRQISSYSFTRLAEEQFNSGAADVLLASTETQKIDKLEGLEHFGALVLDTYRADDENIAYEKLRRFAQERSLILLSSTDPLYLGLVGHMAELPHAVIIERQRGEQAGWFGETSWLSLNGKSLRNEWKVIKEAIEKSKVPVDASGITLSSAQAGGDLTVRMNGTTDGVPVPVLVRATFPPGWRRSDGLRLYPATPLFMLTFADRSFQARFERDGVERASLVVSGCMLSGLVLALLFAKGSRFRVKSREKFPRRLLAPSLRHTSGVLLDRRSRSRTRNRPPAGI